MTRVIRARPRRLLAAAALVGVVALPLGACAAPGGGNADMLRLSSVASMTCSSDTASELRKTAEYIGGLEADPLSQSAVDIVAANAVTPTSTATSTAAATATVDSATQAESNKKFLGTLHAALLTKANECDASPSATGTPTSDAEKAAVVAEAQEWVRRMVTHFAGVTTIPAECQMAKFSVDLTVPEYYTFRPGKESATAFAPDLGKEPCEMSRNYVERLFRDSSLVVTKLRSTGAEVIPPEQQVARTDELFKGGFAARRDAARKVLAWYTSEDPYRQLTIEQRDGPYASNNMTGGSPGSAPTVNTTASNKPSTVIVTTDTTTGKVVKMDRANCGPQDFAPLPPGFVVPEPGEEIELTPKVPSQDINANPLIPTKEKVKATQSATSAAFQPTAPAALPPTYTTPPPPPPSTSVPGSTAVPTPSASVTTVDPVPTHTAVPSPTSW